MKNNHGTGRKKRKRELYRGKTWNTWKQYKPLMLTTLRVITKASFSQWFLQRNHWSVGLGNLLLSQHLTSFLSSTTPKWGYKKDRPRLFFELQTKRMTRQQKFWHWKCKTELQEPWATLSDSEEAPSKLNLPVALSYMKFDIQAFCYTTKINICLVPVFQINFVGFEC